MASGHPEEGSKGGRIRLRRNPYRWLTYHDGSSLHQIVSRLMELLRITV